MGRRRKDNSLLIALFFAPWWYGAIGAAIMLLLRRVFLAWERHLDKPSQWHPSFMPGFVQVSYIFYFLAGVFAAGALGSFIRQRWTNRQQNHEKRLTP